MFTGIIETVGKVVDAEKSLGNLTLTIQSSISRKLKIDESVSHNGVCLTVTKVEDDTHQVVVVEESLNRTNLKSLLVGTEVNIERAMKADGRWDGHIVQGHVDQTVRCVQVKELDGSHYIWFDFDPQNAKLLVEKGSITIDGVSLTIARLETDKFAVAIIPYTFEHTCFNKIQVNNWVNIEFDIIGKYVARSMEGYK